MNNRPLFPDGYKSSWYRNVANKRGISFSELLKEIKREHKYLKYLAFPDEQNRIAKIWRDKNPEKCHAYYAKRWVENKQSEYLRTQKWLSENPGRRKKYNSTVREKDPEKYKETRREDYRKHSEDRKRNVVLWQKKNPHKITHYRHARRAIVNRGIDCSQKIALLNLERFCHWCCIRLTDKTRSIDHVIPLARGGQHIPDNLVAACRSCNSSKGDKFVEDWNWEMYEERAA